MRHGNQCACAHAARGEQRQTRSSRVGSTLWKVRLGKVLCRIMVRSSLGYRSVVVYLFFLARVEPKTFTSQTRLGNCALCLEPTGQLVAPILGERDVPHCVSVLDKVRHSTRLQDVPCICSTVADGICKWNAKWACQLQRQGRNHRHDQVRIYFF